jgi:hypothetical protein
MKNKTLKRRFGLEFLLKNAELFFEDDFAYMVKEHLNQMDQFHFQLFQLI